MIIGTFEIAIALLGLIILMLVGQFDGFGLALFILLCVYGTIGAGLWAIQEWARIVNIFLHALTIPYILYTLPLWEGEVVWQPAVQLFIAIAIIIAMTRPAIRHKFQTVVPKQRP